MKLTPLKLIVLFVITLGFILFVSSLRRETEPDKAPTPSDGTISEFMAPDISGHAIYVADQNAEERITVAIAVFKTSGYVGIYKLSNGNMGELIGHSELLSGVSNDVEVKLNEKVRDEDELAALLFVDDGDGQFEEGEDSFAKDELGNTIQMNFKIDTSASDPVVTF